MNRRDLFKNLAGSSIALSGVRDVNLSTNCMALAPRAVSADLRIFDQGHGECFELTLYQKPWPKVGDLVKFEHKSAHLIGRVTAFTTECIHGTDRVFYHVQGTVQAWDAKAAIDRT